MVVNRRKTKAHGIFRGKRAPTEAAE